MDDRWVYDGTNVADVSRTKLFTTDVASFIRRTSVLLLLVSCSATTWYLIKLTAWSPYTALPAAALRLHYRGYSHSGSKGAEVAYS
ncbi:unnamed protein product [Haemonchus placei]|uniref:Neur_chan_memb domain-containing protein n=1 Tax=Haemonchus placei TaxID=6290 RepID=A0A0N4WJP1_HAEPC|nr:unnamed protein product [Haemonchus placei]